jgi:hypothetical protein
MQSELTIWQENLNKSQMRQHDLISSSMLVKMGADIATLQEPAIIILGKTIVSRD